MKPGRGKEKGGAYEREISEKLSLWLSAGKRKDLLCRTVSSGGQYTHVGLGIPGDIRSQDPLSFAFCNAYVIECKHWKDLEMILFLRRKGMLYEALEKVAKEGNSKGKSWMLIARQNHMPDFLILPFNNFNSNVVYAWRGEGYHRNDLAMPEYHILFSKNAVLFRLDEFIRLISPEKLIHIPLRGENIERRTPVAPSTSGGSTSTTDTGGSPSLVEAKPL